MLSRALFFDEPTTLDLEDLRDICPGATGDVVLPSGERWTTISIGSSTVIPRGPVLCYVLDYVRGVDCGVYYMLSHVEGASAPVPSPSPVPVFDKEVAHRLSNKAVPPMLRYYVEVRNTVTNQSLEIVALFASGIGYSSFPGAEARGVAAMGTVVVSTLAGPHVSSWGVVGTRLLSRAVVGPLQRLASGGAYETWIRSELPTELQSVAAHRYGGPARALLSGDVSVIGMNNIAAWGLCVHPTRGLVHCNHEVPSFPLSEPIEFWYEVEVTNPLNGKSELYTAIVDTGAAISAFPSAGLLLDAKAGGFAKVVTHVGTVNAYIGVLLVRCLRRAHRISPSFEWNYDSPRALLTGDGSDFMKANPEIAAQLESPIAVIGLNLMNAWGAQLNPVAGLVASGGLRDPLSSARREIYGATIL